MKILHVIPTLDPLAGGPPLIAGRLAAVQARSGHDVGVMTYNPTDDGQGRIDAEMPAGFDRVTVHTLPPIILAERLFGTHAARIARHLVPDADVVHLHGVWEPQLRVTADVARRFGKPYFTLLNGMLFPWAMRRGTWKKKLSLATGVRKMLDGGVLHCGSADEQIAAQSIGLNGPAVVIPNGISIDESAVPPNFFRSAFPVLGDGPFALFLGRLHRQKGVDLLVPAMAKLPAVKLVIAGPDYGEAGNVGAQIADAGLSDRVIMAGPIFGDLKRAALAEAVCFCLPSRHEGFSLAVLEAMAAKTPVVISPECHFPEAAAAGGGVVTSSDPAAIADAIGRFVDDPAFRAAASAAAVELVSTNYTWDKIAGRTIHEYEKAVDPKGRS